LHAAEQVGQSPIGIWARDQIEPRRPRHQRRSIMLRHASEQPELQMRPGNFEPCEIAQPADHAVLGMLANRAGIDQDNIGVLGTRREGIASLAQDGADRLRIGDIHLAAVGFEINPRRPGTGDSVAHL
jgi:hypothetical protein